MSMRRTAEWYAQRQCAEAARCAAIDRPKARRVDSSIGSTSPTGPRAIALALPWPPSKNRLYVPGTFRRTTEYRQFCDAVSTVVAGMALPPFEGEALLLHIRNFPPNDRGDPSNIEVAVQDALQRTGLFANDKAVRCLHVEHVAMRDPATAGVHVTITQLVGQ